ncbi:sucrase ferredoxin [Frankia sp. R43]|uniref:sucrase ferredoxin n=1 Tax=Frankia sp. R43 TaxID=269536 RepID=UPI0006CA551F|nr:sucrase ferredoxin [Frankia sp. R43]KPM55391.1 sucrase ferredoxin [Frankia sp. R43]
MDVTAGVRPPDVDPDAKIRCSDWARAAAMSPAGTAGTYPGFLLVEIPLPWPRDVGESAQAAALEPLVGPPGYRLQAVVPAQQRPAGEERRVILHARRPGEAGFAGYRRFESAVGCSLYDTVGELVAAAADPGPSALEIPAVDVLVCGHGRRDACCGRLGAGLAVKLEAAGVRPGVNLWRASHLGGHRFAPVCLVLPEGTGWAFADLDLVDSVLSRSGDPERLAGHYRGCSGLADPQVQALELEVLRREGWGVLDRPRSGSVHGTRAELTWAEGGNAVTWSADVRPGRTVAMPDCLSPPSAAAKRQTEWAVSDVVRHEHTSSATSTPRSPDTPLA